MPLARSCLIQGRVVNSPTTAVPTRADNCGPILAVVSDEASAWRVLPVATRMADEAGAALYVLHVRPETWNYGAESLALASFSGDLVDRLAVADLVCKQNEAYNTIVLLSDGYSAPLAAVTLVASRYKIKTIVVCSDHIRGNRRYNARRPLKLFRPYSLANHLSRMTNDWAVIVV
jgi:hypothetical protein